MAKADEAARRLARVHKNAATVALANKLARIVWAVLSRAETFNATRLVVA